jgi:hypothetical protein
LVKDFGATVVAHGEPHAGILRLVFIAYNPPGDDVDGEQVVIQNRGGVAQTMGM